MEFRIGVSAGSAAGYLGFAYATSGDRAVLEKSLTWKPSFN